MHILLFEVAGQRYGLPRDTVREIAPAVTIAALPKAPAIVEGVINLRGEVVPVMDLRSRFRLPAKALEHTDHLIVAWAGERTVVIRADRVVELLEVSDFDIADPKAVTPGSEYVAGVAKTAGGLILIHDLRSFISQAESREISKALPGPREA